MEQHSMLSSLATKRYRSSALSEKTEESEDDRGMPFSRYKVKKPDKPVSAIQKSYIGTPKTKQPGAIFHAPVPKDRDVKAILREDRLPHVSSDDQISADTGKDPKKKRHRSIIGVNLSATRYDVIRTACNRLGFSTVEDDDFASPYLIWNDSFISTERISELKPFQRINHYPGMAEICRKDLLAKNMAKMKKMHPTEFAFVPRTWCLPSDYAQFQQYVKEVKRLNKRKSFIYKPANGAMGNGIKIYKNGEQVPANSENASIVQEYIGKPFLVDGFKCDMRIYVLVTSCDPLRIYFYNDGLLRMSTEKYIHPLDCQNDTLFMHLTNYSVNKKSGQYEKSSSDSTGSKRSIRFLNEYLQKNDYDVALLWRNIIDLIIKTILVAYPHVLQAYRMCRPAAPPGSNSVCFEVLGFDIMLDHKLKPWLIEVNRSPSFGTDEAIDREVKLGLLEETLRLINIRKSDKAKNIQAQKDQAQKRLLKGLNDNKPGDFVDYKGQKKKQMLNKKREELETLLVRLKREAQRDDYEYRSCHRFRRVFPADDKLKYDKYADLLISIFAQFMQGRAGALQREIEMQYSNKLRQEDIMEMLQQYETDGRITNRNLDPSSSSEASSDEETENSRSSRQSASQRSSSVQRSSSRSKIRASPSLQPRSNPGTPVRTRSAVTRLIPIMSRASSVPTSLNSEVTSVGNTTPQTEEMARFTLKYLNELTIKFPGKSHKAAEELLTKLQLNWKFYKPRVASYWLVKLDSIKRRKVIEIVQQNVRITLQKAYRTVDVTQLRLYRLFDKVINRLLWSNGQGLWTTFTTSGNWEVIFNQSSDHVSPVELNCCRRVVQLCQDCLLTVYLFSTNGLTDTSPTTDTQPFVGAAPLAVTRA